LSFDIIFQKTKKENNYFVLKRYFFRFYLTKAELLALTRNDFIRGSADEYRLNINKNFETVKGVRYILTPKTESSIRCITIPQFLYYEAVQYFDSLYEPDPDERLFYFTKSFLLNEIKRVAKAAGLNPIRIHDLRHPYVKPTTKNISL